VITVEISNSSSLLYANQPTLITVAISFGLATSLALLIIFAVTTLISALYYFSLRASKPKPRAILVSLRAAYTLGLLLIILDAAIVQTREERGRLLIINSDLPGMRLAGASGTSARNDVADDLSSRLIADRKLAEQFSILRLTKSPGEQIALEDERSPVTAAVVNLTGTSNIAVDEAERLGRLYAAPLFIVPLSAEKDAPGVSVNSVDSAGIAPLGLPLTVQAMLYGRGLKGHSTLVKLSDEALVVTSTVVDWKEDSESKTVPFLLHPKVEGLHRYTVRADPVEGELNTENNEIRFSVEARKENRKVLFIEDQPTWEGKFIRRALEESDSIVVDYFAQVSRSALIGQQQTGSARNAQSILSDFKQLARYDVLIFGPVGNSSISERAAKNLTAFVERRGGGLIILGSNDFNGSILSQSSSLIHLVPAQTVIKQPSQNRQSAKIENPEDGSGSHFQGAGDSSKGRAADQSYLVPTEDGREVFRMAAGDKLIEKLGPLANSYLLLKSLKAGAVAFAIDGSREQTRAPVLIAAESYGYGRTLLFAPSDSWKIALAETEESKGAFSLLWQSLVFWAAQSADSVSSIRLRTSAVEAGGTVRAYLTARDESFNPFPQLSIRGSIEFYQQGAESMAVKLPLIVEPDATAPGVYELSAPAAGEGNATLSVAFSHAGGGEQRLSLPFYIHKNRAAWRESPEVSERLRDIAQASSGDLCKPDELDLLKSKLMGLNSMKRASSESHRLRNNVTLAFLLPLLMSLEYFLRKRYIAG
jgi:hypothetical protein